MKALLLFILIGVLIGVEGPWGALVGMLGGLGLDIPVTILAGESLMSIFTGWGLVDDVIMCLLKLGFGVTDKFLFSLVVANASHMAEEAYEHYDHTDYQNRRYARYLARENPGQTYIYGDVTPKDLFELGFSGGLLVYRHPSWMEVLKGFLEDNLGLEETADVIAIGGGL